ncbi:MAG: phosphatase PAP2 family protein [Alistipes sp.]|jgi:undecaprenyl-diphosphatase|nr:phosphatase PAP2 family protein [Alistipes sp.]
MNDIRWDWGLFEMLNFDGPAWLDSAMIAVSGIKMWIPLYILIIYIVWRRYGWRGIVALLVAMGVAIGISDIVAGIFKHQGVFANLLPDFPARLRPMHSEGLDFAANGYYTGYVNGTVSAHTATIVAIAMISIYGVRRMWFTLAMSVIALLICYSRIYLACHFPQDILLGMCVGAVAGLCGILLFKSVIKLTTKK